MRLFWRKKKKERFNQKLIHAAKIQHLIHQSKIVINAVVIRSAVINLVSSAPRSSTWCHPLRGHQSQIVITTCRVIRSAVIATRCVIAKRYPSTEESASPQHNTVAKRRQLQLPNTRGISLFHLHFLEQENSIR